MKRFVALTFAAASLAACEQRDRGADAAACNLEEMKTNYPGKVINERNYNEAVRSFQPAETIAARLDALDQDRLFYVQLCMRTKGWVIDKAQAECQKKLRHVERCYVPATPS